MAEPSHDGEDLDELAEDITPTTKRTRSTTSTPAKHGTPGSRVALSPAKINSHFRASKPVAAAESKPQASTPQTPRHRDALSKKVAVTPRHRVIVGGRPLTPRTPRTPTTPRNGAPTIYNEARQLFARGNAPTALFGREAERRELESFVSSRVESIKSGCIYVSGPPGTGKSAFVSEVCRSFESEESVKTAYINCMSAKDERDIYGKLLEEFGNEEGVLQGDEMPTLKKMFFRRDCTYLVTLDEIDRLLDLDLELLYSLFEWSLLPRTSLVLVGIANALDFTDRFLPRLKSRGLKPRLLPFLPYTAPQIAAVITSKLKSVLPASTATPDHVPFIHPTAIQFLSKKVAAQSGDLRKTFDVCRRAIDLIEAETRDQHVKKATEITPSPTPSPTKTPLIENMNLSSPPTVRTALKIREDAISASLAQLTAETAPRASIAHMARITAAVFSNGTSQRLQSLNLQQKAVLCALSALEQKKRNSASQSVFATPSKSHSAAPTIKEVYEAYSALCKRDNVLHPLTSTEFRDIVGSLETLSLISAVEGKAGSLMMAATPSKRGRGGFGAGVVEERRIASSIGTKELAASLTGAGSGILRGLLEGDDL